MRHCFLFLFLLSSFTIFAQEAPNIIFILADDMGWNGTSVQISPTETGSQSDYYQTPHLEALATSGMTFSQAYAPAAKCSPSRCSILTGQTTARNNFTETSSTVTTDERLLNPASQVVIDDADITIAEWLKSTGLGYRTAHFGKWHLRANGTADHGFDEGDGNTNNDDGAAANGQTEQNDPKKIFELTDKAIDFMQRAVTDNQNADAPFYVQISHYAVHSPIEAQTATINGMATPPNTNLHDNPTFGAMTQDMDTGIGQILAEIENLKNISSRPFYVVFMSDNGASNGMSNNHPLMRGKSFIYEGGIRVPFIISGGNIPANTYSDQHVVGYDLFPTIADLVKTATNNTTALPADLDGMSIVPALQQTSINRTQPLFFHSPHYTDNAAKMPRSAAVSGQYKLVVEYETGNIFLFDLINDIGESTDVSASNPLITNTLCTQLRDHLKTVNTNLPSLNINHSDFNSLGGTSTDVDNDGLEDAWELRELMTYVYGPNDDPDGDNVTNLEELNAGTDPHVNETVLAIDNLTALQATLTQQNQIQLVWQTSTQHADKTIEIERSSGGNNWVKIGQTSLNSQSFLDHTPLSNWNFYRLKITNNGVVNYSATISILLENPNWLVLYPNPSKGNLVLKFQSPIARNTALEIQLLTPKGQLVQVFNTTKKQNINLSLNNFNQGIYWLKILEDGQSIGTKKIVIVN